MVMNFAQAMLMGRSLEAFLNERRDQETVNTSGKAGAQLPQLPPGRRFNSLGEIMQYVCTRTRSTRLSVTSHSQPLINAKHQSQVTNYL
jgi:hypothetical protein